MSMISITDPVLSTVQNLKFHNLSFFRFQYRVLVCHTPKEVNFWFDYVVERSCNNYLNFGLDIKYDDNNRPAVLQICCENDCLIFQLHRINKIPGALIFYARNPNCSFIGDGIKQHAEDLYREFGLKFHHAVDIRDVAALYLGKILPSTKLESIVRDTLRVKIEWRKNLRLSNWMDESLTLDQIKYAATQVIVLTEIKSYKNWPLVNNIH